METPTRFGKFLTVVFLKARLYRRFLSRQLDAIFAPLELHQVSNMFEIPAISRRQIALKIAPGLQVRFWSCIFSAAKIASFLRQKSPACVNGTLDHSILCRGGTVRWGWQAFSATGARLARLRTQATKRPWKESRSCITTSFHKYENLWRSESYGNKALTYKPTMLCVWISM